MTKAKQERTSIFGPGGKPGTIKDAPVNTVFVPQPYGAIVERNGNGCTGIGTVGLATCWAPVLYTSTHIFVGHFDTREDELECLDAAIDRMRELNSGMDVSCVLVNTGHLPTLGAVEDLLRVRGVDYDPAQNKKTLSDFYVTLTNPGNVKPCRDPGNVHNSANFDAVRTASDGNIYRLRRDNRSLHIKATNYQAP